MRTRSVPLISELESRIVAGNICEYICMYAIDNDNQRQLFLRNHVFAERVRHIWSWHADIKIQ